METGWRIKGVSERWSGKKENLMKNWGRWIVQNESSSETVPTILNSLHNVSFIQKPLHLTEVNFLKGLSRECVPENCIGRKLSVSYFKVQVAWQPADTPTLKSLGVSACPKYTTRTHLEELFFLISYTLYKNVWSLKFGKQKLWLCQGWGEKSKNCL